jgi:hypothetical protein
MKENTKNFAKLYNIDRFYNGQTKNPPADNEEWITISDWMNEHRMQDRDTPEADGKVLETKSVSWPMLFSHKRHLSDLYKQHNLLESLFPYTRSCEGETDETNNHTTVCKRCWWCRERFWGFGVYE